MRRRVWIAAAVGGAVGAGALLGFGPVVRSAIADRAAAYGASIEVEHVVPSFSGVHLRGVELEIADVPGVTFWFSDVVVGWDRRPVSAEGGKVIAVGPADELVHALEAWRAKYRSGGGGGGGGSLTLSGLEIDWRDAEESADQHVHATGVRVSREGGRWSVASERVSATLGDAHGDLEGFAVTVARTEEGDFRVERLESHGLSVRYTMGALALPGGEDAIPAGGPGEAADGAAGEGEKKAPSAENGKPSTHDGAAEPGEGEEAAGAARVARARRAHDLARVFARRLEGWVAPDAPIDLRGASVELVVAGERLKLGPGRVAFRRTEGDLVLGLKPEAPAKDNALTFTVRVPVATHDEKEPAARPVIGELEGGPVSLSLLGLKDGDFGLTDVSRAFLESHVRMVLPPDGEQLSLSGRGELHDLSLRSPRLAEEPVVDLDLAWRGDLSLELARSAVTAKELEIDLGDARLLLAGRYERHGGGHRVDLSFEVPMVECQRAFSSIPKAMVPLLEGMRFAGTLAAKGHARFDTAQLPKSFDVGWQGALGCRITDVPPNVDVARFRKRFEKIVYSPKAEERKMSFGPESDSWVSIGGISRHMQTAVLICEDGRFFRHAGFDQEAIVNSIRENLIAGSFRRGASTISMQLAKNLYLRRTKTVSRKLQEAILTMYLEQELTKDEMMELYLNVIEFGPMVYGIGPAARHYFNAHPGRLSLSQALYLASILPNPKVQHFGAGGAVSAGHLRYLRLLAKIAHKIGRIDDDELDHALRETPVFGSPAPMVAPADDLSVEEGSAVVPHDTL